MALAEKVLIFTFFFAILVSNNADGKRPSLPPYITQCSRSSSDFSNCVNQNAQSSVERFSKGIPEFGVPSLDPMDLGKIKIDTAGLKLHFNDVIIKGLGRSKINNFKVNLKKKKAGVDIVSNVTMTGKYKIDGRILILPVRGHGNFKVDLMNLNLINKYTFNSYLGDDGQDHWRMEITKRMYKMDKAVFDFENLFDGNRLLGEPVIRFANENWQTIMSDIAPDTVDEIINACQKIMNKFFEALSIETLSKP